MVNKRDELIKEAYKRFPVGTIFNAIAGSSSQKIKKNSHFRIYNDSDISYLGMSGFLLRKGEWAEIIQLPKSINNELKIEIW